MASSEHCRIRNVTRAVITRNDSVLLVEIEDGGARWYTLPGGGQEFGETLRECLTRECAEELALPVKVHQCIMVREFIGPRRAKTVGPVGAKHFVEFYFVVSFDSEPNLVPRDRQHRRLLWCRIHDLPTINFFPRVLAEELLLRLTLAPAPSLYTGDAD